MRVLIDHHARLLGITLGKTKDSATLINTLELYWALQAPTTDRHIYIQTEIESSQVF